MLTGGLGGTTGKRASSAATSTSPISTRTAPSRYFDGVSYHPYTYPLLPSDDAGQRSWSRMLNARQTMVANGDADKKIWVTEYGAPTGGAGIGRPGSSRRRSCTTPTGSGPSYSWAGPLCWFDYRDKGTDTSDHGNFFGLYTNDGQPKVALQQYETLVRSAR